MIDSFCKLPHSLFFFLLSTPLEKSKVSFHQLVTDNLDTKVDEHQASSISRVSLVICLIYLLYPVDSATNF